MTRALFIGGPLDGELRDVMLGGMGVLVTANDYSGCLAMDNALDMAGDIDPRMVIKQVVYGPRLIAGQYLYAVRDASDAEVMALLLEQYTKTKCRRPEY